jgi:hypothetical protein
VRQGPVVDLLLKVLIAAFCADVLSGAPQPRT